MDQTLARTTLAKVTGRLIPFMFILYVANFLDRVNIGIAGLTMRQDLGLSASAFGLGAGIFFLGYFLFEIPSNLVLDKVGARIWIARIMITWGIISSLTMFTNSPTIFLIFRFLLGVAEAGFFAGMILYLTYWFPARERARSVAGFLTAVAIAGVIGNPISGALLRLEGVGGLHGWQWLFLIEGIPSIVLGIVVLFYLTDKPEQAQWLTSEERAWLTSHLAAERDATRAREPIELLPALMNGRVWLLALIYFGFVIGLYAFAIWLPTIIKGFSGLGNTGVSLLSAIPFVFAAIAMVIVARSSDARRERRWHVAGCAFVGAAGLLLSIYLHSPVGAMIALCIAAVGIYSGLGPFWTFAPAFLTGTAAAGGIALINSVGNLGGFFGPYIAGAVKSATGSFTGALWVLVVCLIVAGVLALAMPHREPDVAA
ncbi:MAG: MFS transporter [Vulcanimicrobiaceae bacterium]